LIIYVVLTIPLPYFFAFKVQKFGFLTDLSNETNNRGVGIWIAFVIGSGLQTIGYLIIIGKTNWWHVSEISQNRLRLKTQLLSNYESCEFSTQASRVIDDADEKQCKFMLF
jgi:hypothetical protein